MLVQIDQQFLKIKVSICSLSEVRIKKKGALRRRLQLILPKEHLIIIEVFSKDLLFTCT